MLNLTHQLEYRVFVASKFERATEMLCVVLEGIPGTDCGWKEEFRKKASVHSVILGIHCIPVISIIIVVCIYMVVKYRVTQSK